MTRVDSEATWPAGGGEMAERIRAHDWRETPLGPIEGWPHSLRTTVDLILAMPGPASILWGPEHIQLYNDAYIPIARNRHPALLGRPAAENWPEVHVGVLAPVMEAAFASRATRLANLSVELQEADGTLENRAFDTSWSPIRDEAGAVGGALEILFEVTDRRRAEEALRASEEQHREALDTMSEGFALLDADFTILDVNAETVRLDGRAREEIVGRNHWEAFPGSEDSPQGEMFKRVMRDRVPEAIEHSYAWPDGKTLWIDTRAYPTSHGRIGILWRDITARKRTEAVLRESEERQAFLLSLSDVLRATPDQMIGQKAIEMLADKLVLDLCYVVTVRPEEDRADVAHQWRRQEESPAVPAAIRLSDFPQAFVQWQTHTLVSEDMIQDPALTDTDRKNVAAMGFGALIAAPVRRGSGNPIWSIIAVMARSRRWSAAEVALVEETAERTWSAIERARAEAALRDSEERFRTFAEASGDVLWIVDATTRGVEYISPAYERIWGDPREAVMADLGAWSARIHPDDLAPARAGFERLLAGHEYTAEYRLRHRDGSTRFVRDTGFPIFDDAGRVRRAAGIAQDLTARRTAENALAESERRWRTLMDGIPQLVWRSCDKGMWTWSSPQWQEFTGQSLEQSIGLGWLDALHPDDRDTAMQAWEAARPHGMLDVEYRVRRARDGVYLWHHTRSVPVRDEHGRIEEWLGTTTDVQVLKEMQERQAVLVAELQHRTRNLMGVVRSVSDKTARSSRDLADFRARFRNRLDSLARVQGLLSRLNDADRVTFDDLIRTELAAMHGGGERVTLDGPAGVRLRSSTVQTLAMALHELATNAVKYGALGPAQAQARLAVCWSLEPCGEDGKPWLHIDWRERGVAMASPTGPTGQGRELIERALPYQLGARTDYALTPDGVHCTISVPVSAMSEAAGHG